MRAILPLAWGVTALGAWAAGAGPPPGEKPTTILGESAANWVVDRFAGNSRAGPLFFQGPAREAGGIGRCAVAPAPDGSVFLATGLKWAHDRILRVDPGGTLRLVAGGGASLEDGPAERARILVGTRGSSMVWSEADRSIYFVHTMVPALRRLYRKGERWFVQTVAGNPHRAGHADGPAREALFAEPSSIAVTSTGTVYVLDGTDTLRKVENGTVSTIARFRRGPEIVDGPLAKATMAVTDMSGHIALGEDDHTLYVADHWHFAVRRIDLRTMTVKRVAGLVKGTSRRFNRNADGAALTEASFNSGCAYVRWDPVHRALWCGGPDEQRFRWLKGGRVLTVIGRRGRRNWPLDDLGVPAEKVSVAWCNVAAVDARGGVYLVAGSHRGVWRARLKEGRR